MKPIDLAMKYIDIVFSNGDFDRLRQFLAQDLKFVGPMFTFNSAEDYINSTKADPPIDFEYEILKTYEDLDSACLVYQFSKPGISTTMTQIFEIEKDKIVKILLVFDSAAFAQN